MRSLTFSVIIPGILFVLGIIIILLGVPHGVFLSGIAALWLVIGFLISYGEDEEQPEGTGKR